MINKIFVFPQYSINGNSYDFRIKPKRNNNKNCKLKYYIILPFTKNIVHRDTMFIDSADHNNFIPFYYVLLQKH